MPFIFPMRLFAYAPKDVRDKLGIGPGTLLQFSAEGGRLVATKVITDHPAQRLMGRHSKGRRTDDVMAELRGKS